MAKTVMTSRQKKAIHTKNTIHNAAISLMQKQGIQQTTIEEICKKAKVSVGSFYTYFKSKDDVITSVFKSADQYFENVVEQELAGLPVEEKITNFFRHYARYNYDTGLDFTTRLYFNSENQHFLERDRYMHVLLRSILEEARDNDYFEPGISLSELEEFLFLFARGVVSDWCLHGGNYDLEQKMVFYFKSILFGGISAYKNTAL